MLKQCSIAVVAAVLLLAPTPSDAFTFNGVTVGDPGNACDTQPQGCFGAVATRFQISQLEVTNAEFVEFLNAVAADDTFLIYDTAMGSGFGGITRTGSAGSYSYSAIAGREDLAVNRITFWAAARFANWLHNGQPSGPQGSATTEDGAYTLTPTGIANNTVTRNAGALFFIPTEDEWYKAAYYDTGSATYFDYPAGTDTEIVCAAPGATANTANCSSAVGDIADVGGYTGAASPNGTFDQGGNLQEWNETIDTTVRIIRGASFTESPISLGGQHRDAGFPMFTSSFRGFRVASPAPATPTVPSLGLLGMAVLVTLVGAAGWRRLRA